MRADMLPTAVWLLLSPTAFLSLAAALTYFILRLQCVLRVQKSEDGIPYGAWFYVAVEALTIVPRTLPYILRILAVQKPHRHKQLLAVEEGDVPSVDVLVTCCHEDIDIILDTVRAACSLDYPKDRYRVFVCDDGASSHVKSAVEALPYSNVFYHARSKGAVPDYKAGNLNAGLRYSRSTDCEQNAAAETTAWGSAILSRVSSPDSSSSAGPSECSVPHTPSEYVAGLDADMIPEPHWLRTLLPHLIDDPAMALVCPPQTFYDVPKNDLLIQTMDHFAGVTEVVNDALGHADCLGSGYILRRSAIDAIGGFPVESLSEDVCCSATLLAAGWKTAFVHEPLQFGSVPDSLYAHVKQRTRWFVGHIQTALLFELRFFGTRGRRLSFLQKLAGLSFDLVQFVQIPIVLAYFAIPYALLRGHAMVTWSTIDEMRTLMRSAILMSLTHWLHQGVVNLIAGLGNGRFDLRIASYGTELDQWLAPYIAESFFRSFVLPATLGGRKAGFTPSGSLRDDFQERDAKRRAPIHRRLFHSLIHQRLFIHVAFVLSSLVGLILTIHRAANLPEQATYLLARIGWPPLMWTSYVVSALYPILYVLSPPTTPDRESLLVRDEKTGVAYPTAEARKPQSDAWGWWKYLRPGFAMVYTMGLFIVSARL